MQTNYLYIYLDEFPTNSVNLIFSIYPDRGDSEQWMYNLEYNCEHESDDVFSS